MSDNRSLVSNIDTANYNSLVAYINACYCKKWGYDFKYYQPYLKDLTNPELYNCLDPNNGGVRHASWSKLLAATRAMENKQYSHIVYIDSDCIFKEFNKPLTYLLNQTRHDISFLDNSPWGSDKPCAGFFILKNTEYTRKVLDMWYAVSIPSKNAQHAWEQDGLWKIRDTLSYDLLNSEGWFFEAPQQYLRHVGSHQNAQRIPYFRKYVNSLLPIYGEYSTVIKSIEVDLFSTVT